MHRPVIDSPDALRDWFRRCGVGVPLDLCVGPLPQTGVFIARWSRREPDTTVQVMQPHPGFFRIALMLEPLESQIWSGERPVWGGVIGANRFRICAPGSRGRWRQLSGCDIVNLFVPVETVERLRVAGGLPEDCSLGNTAYRPDRHVLELVLKMLEAEVLAGPLATVLRDALATALLAYLLEHHARAAPEAAAPRGLGGVRLRRVLAFIAENATRELAIAEMAAMCGMSESHFSREFRAAVGLPPHQYALKLRLDRACEALAGGDRMLMDIALELGFSSASHFSRAFAQRHGMPPARYRQLHRRPI